MSFMKLLSRSSMLLFLSVMLIIAGAVGTAQGRAPMTFSFSAGTGYAPMGEWRDFAESIRNGPYEKDKYGEYLDFKITYFWAKKHALQLGIGHIKHSATKFLYDYTSLDGGSFEYIYLGAIRWRFSTFPFSLSHEFYPVGVERSVVPYLGYGLELLITKVSAKWDYYYIYPPPIDGPINLGDKYDEMGYGFHIHAGMKSFLGKKFFIESQIRWRYADGRGLSDEKGDIKVAFTGLDLTAGLGYRF